MKKIKVENGYYILKLDDVLLEKKISMNKVIEDTNTNFYAVKRVATGETSRFDLGVLARICSYLKCELDEIVEYIPDNK